MSEFTLGGHISDELPEFDGVTRLFPLPNVVLFPTMMLPLHIFEPRYRRMVADAIDSDRLITMVLLKPGFESDYEAAPPIHDVGCIGRIVRHERLADGRSNLVLRGAKRVRIEVETPADTPYRVARATLIEELDSSFEEAVGTPSRARLIELLGAIVTAASVPALRPLAIPLESTLGAVCDLAAQVLGLDVAVKQALLEEFHVARRAAAIEAWMIRMLAMAESPVRASPRLLDSSLN